MTRIHTLSDIGEGKKLGDIPYNRYPASRAELENQLVYANQDREIAIECALSGSSIDNKSGFSDLHELKYGLSAVEVRLSEIYLCVIDTSSAIKQSKKKSLSNLNIEKWLNGQMLKSVYLSMSVETEMMNIIILEGIESDFGMALRPGLIKSIIQALTGTNVKKNL
ncbi:2898_t:CDS:2 [Acaulospora morrowiae]|uniref:2898_t:CDS:1 n=1 Tax=Acaulospora morrowiae TaxID=94023 RepID=A0A9N8ZI12_9GLOM|nr:2898_t:CDS:2 [Acaulospora morrowiae]